MSSKPKSQPISCPGGQELTDKWRNEFHNELVNLNYDNLIFMLTMADVVMTRNGKAYGMEQETC